MLPNDFKLAGISFFYSDAIALLQHSPIHRFLYSFPNIRFQQFRIPHLRINTVAEEYIHRLVFRVHPSTSTGKSGMSIYRFRSGRSTRAALHNGYIRLVESQTATADGGFSVVNKRQVASLKKRLPLNSPPFSNI